MNSIFVWVTLVISFFLLILTGLSYKEKASNTYVTCLYILSLLLTKYIFYCLQILCYNNSVLVELFFTIGLIFKPIIAALFLFLALSLLTTNFQQQILNKVFKLTSFFFVGTILTNPIHKLVFTLTGINTKYKLGISSGILMDITDIYSGLCILLGFLIILYSIIKNKNKESYILTFGSGILAVISYLFTFIDTPSDTSSIISLILATILYSFILKINNFNIIPILNSNNKKLENLPMLVVNNDLIIKDLNNSLKELFREIDFSNAKGRKATDIFRAYPAISYSLKNQKDESVIINNDEYNIKAYTSIEKKKKALTTTLVFEKLKLENSIYKHSEINTIDYLTQVKNKDYFITILSYEYDRSNRYDLPFALLYIDVDNFADINDKYGYIAGDLILKSIASIINKEIRKTDILARLEDDMFGLLLTHTNTKFAELVAERIRSKVEKNVLAYEGKIIKSTISIGISGCDTPSNIQLDIYMSKAQKALDKAKRKEKNCIMTEFL